MASNGLHRSDGVLDDEIITRLRQAIRRLARRLNQSSTDEGLTPSQASALGVIAGYGQLSLPELARLERVNPTMLSRVIGHLERSGLVDRAPDPNDMRSAVVTLTDRGAQVARRIKSNRAHVIVSAAGELSVDDQRRLTDAVPVLESLVEQLLEQEAAAEQLLDR